MTLSVKDEIAIMRRRWPEFRVTGSCRYVVTWQGVLRPLRGAYEVRILYGPRFWIGDYRITNRAPRIELVSPAMVLHHPRTGERVPHVFDTPVGPISPLLCVFDSLAGDWEPGMPIADTIVPWVNDWLGCYELWLATGKWTGGGRHPGEGGFGAQERRTRPKVAIDAIEQRRRGIRVAALTGTHASRLLLENKMTDEREDPASPVMPVHSAA